MSIIKHLKEGKYTAAMDMIHTHMDEAAEDRIKTLRNRAQTHSDQIYANYGKAKYSKDPAERAREMRKSKIHKRMAFNLKSQAAALERKRELGEETISDFRDMLAEDYGLENLTMEDAAAILDEVIDRMDHIPKD